VNVISVTIYSLSHIPIYMETKKIILIFCSLLLLSNLVFIVNFFWSLITWVWFLDSFENRYNLGNKNYSIEIYENAIEEYSSAIAKNPDNYKSYHNLAASRTPYQAYPRDLILLTASEFETNQRTYPRATESILNLVVWESHLPQASKRWTLPLLKR